MFHCVLSLFFLWFTLHIIFIVAVAFSLGCSGGGLWWFCIFLRCCSKFVLLCWHCYSLTMIAYFIRMQDMFLYYIFSLSFQGKLKILINKSSYVTLCCLLRYCSCFFAAVALLISVLHTCSFPGLVFCFCHSSSSSS